MTAEITLDEAKLHCRIDDDYEEVENIPVEVKEKTVKWNVKDEDALENGNIKKAIKLLVGKSKISNEAIEISSLDAYKRPWNYYGKIVAISGMVAFAEDYPPESDLNRKFGTDSYRIHHIRSNWLERAYENISSLFF